MSNEKRLEAYRKSQKKRASDKKLLGYSQISCWVKNITKTKIYDIKEKEGFDTIGDVIDIKFEDSHTCD